MTDISVIVLTKDEEKHMPRFFEKLAPLEPREVFLVDCLSTDRTKEIAESHGAVVIPHAWPGLYAVQFNWALDNCPVTSKWVLRLDADEYLEPATIERLKEFISRTPVQDAGSSDEVTGLTLELRRVFMGGVIHHGTNGIRLLRVWQKGCCRIEEREMDEHMMLLRGKQIDFDGAFYDDNLMSFEVWKSKHYVYARKEANNYFQTFSHPERVKNPSPTDLLKFKYYRAPRYLRAFGYFCIRYFLKGGFLDGIAGWRWHFWQGLWYRWLVDREIGSLREVRA